MKRRYTLKEIEHKSNIVQTLFTIYIICMVLLIATGIGDHGIEVGAHKTNNIGNGFFYLMIAVVGILSAIFYGIYYYLMDEKWGITIKCPYCGKSMDTAKISISPADGFLGTQTCQKCGEKFTPTFKDAE
ncbi:MAG: hypothetical protein IJN37_10910 [Clostridia bacterium]|nr:hypothetical protein [Clostridia bacterium]